MQVAKQDLEVPDLGVVFREIVHLAVQHETHIEIFATTF
jgi:hypothetical protein